MLLVLGINQLDSVGLEAGERAFLVSAHQAAIASDISCKNGGNPPFDVRLDHKYRPDYRDFAMSVRSGAKCVY
jgi:hypothetical protein